MKNGHPIPLELLEQIDMIVKKKNGGVELVIICHGYLDGSEYTQKRIMDKINNYLTFIKNADYEQEFGAVSIKKTIIVLKCSGLDSIITELIESIKAQLILYSVGIKIEII